MLWSDRAFCGRSDLFFVFFVLRDTGAPDPAGPAQRPDRVRQVAPALPGIIMDDHCGHVFWRHKAGGYRSCGSRVQQGSKKKKTGLPVHDRAGHSRAGSRRSRHTSRNPTGTMRFGPAFPGYRPMLPDREQCGEGRRIERPANPVQHRKKQKIYGLPYRNRINCSRLYPRFHA